LLSSAFRNRFGWGLACRAAVLDCLGRDSPGFLGDLPFGIFFVRGRDLARDVTHQVANPLAINSKIAVARFGRPTVDAKADRSRLTEEIR